MSADCYFNSIKVRLEQSIPGAIEKISEISIFKSEDEGGTLWTYILENLENGKTKMTIRETMYIYHPYLRFMLKYILKDENAKGEFFRNIKRFIKKNNKNKRG
mgnify:CR=1 FL=1